MIWLDRRRAGPLHQFGGIENSALTAISSALAF
jgi:hypothetical protein